MTSPNSIDPWEREQRRQHLVRLLGVDPLVPRFDPPGARQPKRPAPPTPVAPPAIAAAEPQASVDTAKPAATRVAPVLGSRTDERRHVAAPAQVDASATPEAGPLTRASSQPEPAAAVAFQLLIAAAGKWLWIEQLEDGLLRRDQLQLIEAMARAMTPEDTTLSHFVFEWPLVQHAHVARDADSARDSVAGQLRRLAREQGVQGLILMGEACGEWAVVPPALTGLAIPATLAMLTNPALKRDAWAVLKPHAQTR